MNPLQIKNKDHLKDGSFALVHIIFCEHITTSYDVLKYSFGIEGNKYILNFIIIGRTDKVSFLGQKTED